MTAPATPRKAAKSKPRKAATKKPRKAVKKKAAAKKAALVQKPARKKAARKAPAGKTARTKKDPAKAKKAATKKAVKKSAARKAAPKKAPKKKTAAKSGASAKKARASRKPKLTAAQRTLALVERVLDEHQADDVAVVDLAGKSTMADYMVVASGRNPRHISAMADHLKSRLKTPGGRPPPIEGLGGTDWVLVDAGDVVVHLFRPEARGLYNLEKMWGPEWSAEPEEE